VYCVADDNPVSEYVVAVLPVLDTILDQLVPPSVDLSISYPDTVPEGAVQERLICDVEVAVAASPVGELGGVVVVVGVDIVGESGIEGVLAPVLLIADTL